MKKTLTLFLIMLAIAANAQVAIIQDKDGFTNVRNKPAKEAEIIYQLKENEVFWYDIEDENKKEEWVEIYIAKNKYSLGNYPDEAFKGYIHITRLKQLGQLTQALNSDISFKYKIRPFNIKKHYIDYHDEKWIKSIDGRNPWGIDGNSPKTEVENISVTINGKDILISQSLFQDIYECDNNFKVYKNGNTFFLYQMNGDGAGAYEIVWVITENGVIQRLVGTMI